MLNTIYQLVAPRRFEVKVCDQTITPNSLVIRPTHLSICNADQRYYQGTRGAEIMAKKLPMALIHEGIGEVVFDGTGAYEAGDCVVMIPNLPVEENDRIAENYLRSSKFRGSSADGFMQELVVTSHDRVVPLPSSINKDVAAFTEIVSVAVHAISRFNPMLLSGDDPIGIWGDGNLGFIVALLLRKMYPGIKLVVLGHTYEKLSDFAFADLAYTTDQMPGDLKVAGAFECAGGRGSESAIEQIIDHIIPEGTISLLGVSENPVPVNTRMILEKGLRLYGSSRSGRPDFVNTVNLYKSDPSVVAHLERIVGQVIEVSAVDDMVYAFESDIKKRFGKTVMHWNK